MICSQYDQGRYDDYDDDDRRLMFIFCSHQKPIKPYEYAPGNITSSILASSSSPITIYRASASIRRRLNDDARKCLISAAADTAADYTKGKCPQQQRRAGEVWRAAGNKALPPEDGGGGGG